MNKHFLSDNAAGIHPRIMQAMIDANVGHESAYGHDRYTQTAAALFKQHFGKSSESFLVLTGTGANVLALQSVMQSYEAVICADSSHLQNDECGAPEKILGSKLLVAKTTLGKLTVENIQPLLYDTDMVHRAQPKVVSIAQCTEWGTVYTPQEIQTLADFCHQHQLLLHVDGSRLSNAAAALNVDFHTLTQGAGVDLLSFGGTKNGLFGAEAVIFLKPNLEHAFEFFRKQSMQLTSKMRFIAAQFIEMLSNNLWRSLAAHANQMAALLAQEIKDVIKPVMPVESNVVFAKLPSQAAIQSLQSRYQFAVWHSNENIVRWMTAFDTTPEEVKDFAKQIREVCSDS